MTSLLTIGTKSKPLICCHHLSKSASSLLVINWSDWIFLHKKQQLKLIEIRIYFKYGFAFPPAGPNLGSLSKSLNSVWSTDPGSHILCSGHMTGQSTGAMSPVDYCVIYYCAIWKMLTWRHSWGTSLQIIPWENGESSFRMPCNTPNLWPLNGAVFPIGRRHGSRNERVKTGVAQLTLTLSDPPEECVLPFPLTLGFLKFRTSGSYRNGTQQVCHWT